MLRAYNDTYNIIYYVINLTVNTSVTKFNVAKLTLNLGHDIVI